MVYRKGTDTWDFWHLLIVNLRIKSFVTIFRKMKIILQNIQMNKLYNAIRYICNYVMIFL